MRIHRINIRTKGTKTAMVIEQLYSLHFDYILLILLISSSVANSLVCPGECCLEVVEKNSNKSISLNQGTTM